MSKSLKHAKKSGAARAAGGVEPVTVTKLKTKLGTLLSVLMGIGLVVGFVLQTMAVSATQAQVVAQPLPVRPLPPSSDLYNNSPLFPQSSQVQSGLGGLAQLAHESLNGSLAAGGIGDSLVNNAKQRLFDLPVSTADNWANGQGGTTTNWNGTISPSGNGFFSPNPSPFTPPSSTSIAPKSRSGFSMSADAPSSGLTVENNKGYVRVRDRQGRLLAEGSVNRNGALSFTINNKEGLNPNTGRPTGVRIPDAQRVKGGLIFDALFNECNQNGRVGSIIGVWTNTSGLSDNLDKFREAVKRGVPPEEAALNNTFTGHEAQKRGLTRANILRQDPTRVNVEFTK
jgi:hypothetical protein